MAFSKRARCASNRLFEVDMGREAVKNSFGRNNGSAVPFFPFIYTDFDINDSLVLRFL